MRNRFVIGNWKLNGSLVVNQQLLRAVATGARSQEGKFVAVCVPAPYLSQARQELSGTAIGWGSQDVSRYVSGAYTGDVSAQMVTDFGSKYAIVGHSERRAVFGESDEVVAEKFGRAREFGLTPILCVGESLHERESGQTELVVLRQLQAVIKVFGISGIADCVLAYEPVWAIGTGKTATPQQAEAVHAFLRSEIGRQDSSVAKSLSILYGGSVKKSNAAELFAMPNIDGGLIGGASLVADEFLGICNAL